ncbi:MAG: hypothetical protein JWM93_2422 [Frankiales bacterium]|nr:hypothetical protein [Frankiales bacterium]
MSFDPQPVSTVWTTDGHVRCTVPWAHVIALTALAVTCAAGGALSPAAGRVLLWTAAVCCALLAARDAFVRPTLETDDAGITLVRTWRPETVAWADVAAIGAYTHRRVQALEVDTGERLLLVPARRLGADLTEVVDALRTERLRARG